ncbi:LysR family transcriptional regulator [Phaeobacter gallaeciensis]|uniref:LysR family transcriptional regulator n=1 Tax=Phaeobacter gallaeciensis TaxID=60890 RepID=UPI00237F2473|nr:LysR family transcriptional regulator [Phaeobacter gallaeciensis]MDE4097521.1 LysR substrate-binding domain-containing protein [Phaeobacter gallaeciensis]MDE4105965.1 LysR substrate-binding domain-containing protein [Phaeobacter gallaeciensis]MDE4110785.1 LysR substrate-binding domain-containing protein [Phaeobacter gallaeciensis]MDE4115256.1 LysR substrate-binding domain-containing protein [Phaeobacter gallaeciensis]MDE4119725.1 LysR substrate-binding domain-containing protein [Phaeobacter
MDKFGVMRAFCRIVDRGSMARAAEDLGVSSSLLSRDLKLLEESLGCRLITRTTRSMSLTEHGRLYYEQADRILQAVDLAEQQVRSGAQVMRGELRINAPHSFGTTVLADLLPRFASRYPDVQLSLVFDDNVLDLVQGGFDVAIRIRASLPDSGLIARKIMPVHQGVFASPEYLADCGQPEAPEDLKRHRTLSYSLAETPLTWEFNGPQRRVTVPISPQLRLGSSIVLRDMIKADMGIGSLPNFLSAPLEATGRIVRVLPDWHLPERTVYTLAASRLSADAKVVAFNDFLAAELAGRP